MTPEEIVADLDARNRDLLAARELPATPVILSLMNAAAMKGFQLGSNTALSMLQGELAVRMMKMDKTREK